MSLKTSYKQILLISLPIMLGSAAQNIIVLCDNIFLYHHDPLDFAAIGLVGAFYLVIVAIGFGFSRGGQILIARKYGERNYLEIGRQFRALVFFEFLMAAVMFFIIQMFSDQIFNAFVENEEIKAKCIAYLDARSYGLFFSFIGVGLIGLYTGIARSTFIMYDTLILMISNIVLNYILIYGKLGIEPMGIRGAAWASTISEIIAFVAFVIYMIWDKENRPFKLWRFKDMKLGLVAQSFSISFPILAQSVLGLGSYFLFFSFIENRSAHELQVSNLIRNVYLILSIPSWGYSSGINTIVSAFIGNRKSQAVQPMTLKTSKLNVFSTLIISVPVLLFPEFFLYPLFGGENGYLIADSKGLLLMLIPILLCFGIGSIYLNGIIGTGHTKSALWIQALGTLLYVIFTYLIIRVFDLNLYWAWSGEFVYWGFILVIAYFYLRSRKWTIRKF